MLRPLIRRLQNLTNMSFQDLWSGFCGFVLVGWAIFAVGCAVYIVDIQLFHIPL